ncbi:unnamed protein product [Cylindrotheca closterium]|uniref:ADP/ATP translocase n=1 Tax=Cylindrotheca closterium TaxID=2856 RepID=A0AAD2FT16_9STRA|nr:unnamed protein product [Cylindrotheca closterium]
MNDSVREVVSGAFAGASTKTLLAPLDRLKLVVQLRGSIPPSANNNNVASNHYQGPVQAMTKILREEGFFALWRGNTSTVVIQGGTTALNFLFLDWYKKTADHLVLGNRGSTAGGEQTYSSSSVSLTRQERIAKSFVSGFLAGGSAITLLYPIGLMRTKLALDVGQETRLYPRGMRDVFLHSYQVNGLTSLYQGFAVALWSVSIYRMVYLGGYDYLKTELVEDYKAKYSNATTTSTTTLTDEDAYRAIPFYQRFLSAQLVSMLASTAHYPLDSVRRRLMMQSDMPKEKRLYKNARHCLVKIYQDEGIAGYYRGLGTNYIRSVGAALLLVSYDYCKELFS